MLPKKNYQIIVTILVCFLNSMAGSTISGLDDCFKELHRRISSQATPGIASMSIDSTDLVFNSLLKNNSPINKIFRVNSNGIIINESTLSRVNHVMRNVSGQQWFNQVQKSGQPYYGITRDSGGPVFLFWVWPLKNTGEQFAGVLAVKIDPAEMVRFIDQTNSLPLRLDVNDKTVYINNWRNSQIAESVSWNITESLTVTGYYKSSSTGQASSDKDTEPDSVSVKSKPQPAYQESPGKVDSVKMKKAGKKPHPGSFLILLLFTGLIIALFFKFGKRWQAVNPQTEAGETDTGNEELSCQGDPDDVMELVDDELFNEKEGLETGTHDDLSKNSTEEGGAFGDGKTGNRKSGDEKNISPQGFYNQKKGAIFRKAQLYFKPVQGINLPDPELARIRDELYREIHSQVIHWVLSESARLSNSLDELFKRIKLLEGTESSELDSIRQDAMRISKEIQIYKNSFSDAKE